uniref:Uncharacterized protein n=2 Tax=Natrinema zhouii TaxID=1710539 RepID=A0A7D6CNW6_9EURY
MEKSDPDSRRVNRRQVMQGGVGLAFGSILSAGVLGMQSDGTNTESPGSQTELRQTEMNHLEYDEYNSWNDMYWRSAGDRDNISLGSFPAYTDGTALQIRARDGNHWGIDTHYEFENGVTKLTSEFNFTLGKDWRMDGREVASCRLWNCAASLGEGFAGGGQPDGTNGWSNRLYVTNWQTDPDGPFHLHSYTYHMDRIYDTDYIIDGERYALAQPEIVPCEWYNFKYTVQVNTVEDGKANPDGAVTYWLDGDKIYHRSDLRFTEDLDSNIIATNGPAVHYGGRYAAPQDLYAYFEDHAMEVERDPRNPC